VRKHLPRREGESRQQADEGKASRHHLEQNNPSKKKKKKKKKTKKNKKKKTKIKKRGGSHEKSEGALRRGEEKRIGVKRGAPSSISGKSILDP